MAAPAILVAPVSNRALAVELPDAPPIAVLPTSSRAIEIEPLSVAPVAVVLHSAARGAAGRDGSSLASFEHVQSSAATPWTVNHNLGRRPAAVSVRSPGGREVTADVLHVSENQLQVHFSLPASGTALVQ